MAIDLIVRLQQASSCKYSRILHHVDATMRTDHVEQRVPNSQVIIFQIFKYVTTCSNMSSFIDPLSSEWIIPSSPMHVIDTLKHFRKSSRFTLQHGPSCVYCIFLRNNKNVEIIFSILPKKSQSYVDIITVQLTH